MRPQKLTLKNFMPFRSTDGQALIVDFSNLDLFAITGPMASGKSSLIDAIVWCLYGRTARYGADSKGVIAAGESTCEVAFDFAIGSRQFRAVRRTGKTTESGLSELEGDEWIQDVSGSERLTARIEELLGLDFDSFTKTVILPQGKYAEFLGSEPSKRRDLLEKILELGVYKRVVERARELETRSKSRAETIRETLQQPQYAGVTRAIIEQRRSEFESLGQEIAQTSAQEETLRALASQAETVQSLGTRLAELRKDEQTRLEECARAQRQLTSAEEQLQARVRLIVEVEQARETLGYDVRRHETLQRAKGYLQEHLAACREMDEKTAALGRVQQELDLLARQSTAQTQEVEHSRRSCEELTATFRARIASHGDSTALTEKLNAARSWKDLHRERVQITDQQQRRTQELASVQQTLETLGKQEEIKEAELQALQQQRDQTRAEEQEKQRQEEEAGRLGKDLHDAVKEERAGEQKTERDRAALYAAEEEVQKQRQAVIDAEQQEQIAARAVEENRRNNEITHLRASLQSGEPCPVCLTPVPDVPAVSPMTQADQRLLQQQLEQARTALTRARQALQQADTTAAAARARKEASDQEFTSRARKRQELQARFLERFPGFPSLKDALAALQTRRQEMILLLNELETKTGAAEQEKKQLTQQREQMQRREAALKEALQGGVALLEKGGRQLADLDTVLAPYRTDDQDPEAVLMGQRQTLLAAEQAVKNAEQTLRQAEGALVTLNTKKVQTEGTLQLLRSEQQAARDRAERAAKAVRENLALDSEASLPALATLTNELDECDRKREQHAVHEQRLESLRKEKEDAERNIAAARAEVQARGEFLSNTRQTVTQTGEELTRTRMTLRTAIQTCAIPGLNPDGEDVVARLAAVHEQGITLRERRSRLEAEMSELERRCEEKEQEEQKLREAETESRLSADLRKLLGAEFTDYLSEGAIKALMHDASVHLKKLTHGRYSFRIEYKRRTIDLLIVDHEDQQRTRPTHSLSGGETFLASLAIALALSQSFREIATGKAAKTSTECLILDEGFGTLDREGLQLVTETLQELRGEEGRMVGIITHVEEVAAAMPMRIEVRRGSRSSTIAVSG
jgi:exonuclease SbcC